MELIVDATVIFTGFMGKGVTKEIIFSDIVRLYAPEYLFDEVEEHKLKIKEFSALSENEVNELLDKFKSIIKIISKERFEKFLLGANLLISDKDDTEYLALSLSMNKTPVWSNDSHFKEQSIVKVYTTSELVKYLKSKGYEFFPDKDITDWLFNLMFLKYTLFICAFFSFSKGLNITMLLLVLK